MKTNELHHLTGGREDTEKFLNDYVDYLMTHSDSGHPAWNLEVIRSGKENRWNYIDGCMITGILRLYEITGQERYLRFACVLTAAVPDSSGSVM